MRDGVGVYILISSLLIRKIEFAQKTTTCKADLTGGKITLSLIQPWKGREY